MARSSNFRTNGMFLLALTLLHPAAAGPGWMNTDGPGSGAERKAGMCTWWGAPNPGYHVVTITTDKPWDEWIEGEKNYNQHIAADLPDSAAAILKDPANGISGKYTWEDGFFDIPEGKTNAGYPKRVPLAESVTSLLTGNQKYRDIAGEKDYMLLFFGAGWCKKCQDFTPRLAKYYAAHKDDKNKTFDVAYFTDDDDSQKYDEFVKTMPESWKAVGYDMSLQFKLKSLLKLHSIPAVVVIDKQGNTVTIEGAEAIQGTKKVTDFPLADGAEFWKDQTPEEAGAGDCATDIDAQVAALKAAVKAKTDKLSGPGLQHYAEKVAGSDPVPTGDAALREFIIKKYDAMIDTAAAAGDADARRRVQQLYEALDEEENNPANKTFQVGETVEVLADFTSDAKGSTEARLVPASIHKGREDVTNTGYITKVEQDPNSIYTKSIQVRFSGDIYHLVWVNSDKFQFVRKVEQSPRY